MKREVIQLDYEEGLKNQIDYKILSLELDQHRPTKRLFHERYKKHQVVLRKLNELYDSAEKVGDSFSSSPKFKAFLTDYKSAMVGYSVENRTVLKKNRSALKRIISAELEKLGPIPPNTKLSPLSSFITKQIEFKLRLLYKLKLTGARKEKLELKIYKILSETSLQKNFSLFKKLQNYRDSHFSVELPSGGKLIKFNYETLEYERDFSFN